MQICRRLAVFLSMLRPAQHLSNYVKSLPPPPPQRHPDIFCKIFLSFCNKSTEKSLQSGILKSEGGKTVRTQSVPSRRSCIYGNTKRIPKVIPIPSQAAICCTHTRQQRTNMQPEKGVTGHFCTSSSPAPYLNHKKALQLRAHKCRCQSAGICCRLQLCPVVL